MGSHTASSSGVLGESSKVPCPAAAWLLEGGVAIAASIAASNSAKLASCSEVILSCDISTAISILVSSKCWQQVFSWSPQKTSKNKQERHHSRKIEKAVQPVTKKTGVKKISRKKKSNMLSNPERDQLSCSHCTTAPTQLLSCQHIRHPPRL